MCSCSVYVVAHCSVQTLFPETISRVVYFCALYQPTGLAVLLGDTPRHKARCLWQTIESLMPCLTYYRHLKLLGGGEEQLNQKVTKAIKWPNCIPFGCSTFLGLSNFWGCQGKRRERGRAEDMWTPLSKSSSEERTHVWESLVTTFHVLDCFTVLFCSFELLWPLLSIISR